MHFPVVSIFVALLGAVVGFLIGAPVAFAITRIFLRLSEGQKPVWKDMLEGFKLFWRTVWAMFLVMAFLLLWFLAFAAPAAIMLLIGGLILQGGWFMGSVFLANLAGTLSALFSSIGVALILAAIGVFVVKALSYSMTIFILADNPNLTGMQALKESIRIMDGNKSKLFGLELSFTVWLLISIVTFGLALVFVLPYMMMTLVNFYKDIKNKPAEAPAVAAE